MTDSIRFALLGPLHASRPGGGIVDLGTRRQSAVLAGLLSAPNQVVSTDALLHGIWGDDCPASGSRLLATYVYRLRRVLDGGGPTIERSCGGYRLRIDEGALDTTEFDQAVARASEHKSAGRYGQARADLAQALALWRGEPMTGLPGELLESERARWRKKRLRAAESRAELGMLCGEDDLAVTELTELRREEPLSERVAALLMVALYRTGRQVDALSVYTDLNARLRAELGVEPGKELSTVHSQVLRGDDQALGLCDPVPSPSPSVPTLPVPTIRDDLPLAPPVLAGRALELDHVVESSDTGTGARIVAVDGMPGVGKTAFALEAAGRLRGQHPDGRFYLDLCSGQPDEAPMSTAEASRRLLLAAGYRDAELPKSTQERAALWRSAVAGRRVLLVLDDAEDVAQVLPLLPSTPGCTVLVVSRNRLPALPRTTAVALRPLSSREGRALLANTVGWQRIEREHTDVAQVVELCGGLPELLAGVGARVGLGVVSFADLLAELSSDSGLWCLAPAGVRDLDALFGPCWDRLAPEERDVLHGLATTGTAGAQTAMESLTRANLIGESHEGRGELHPAVREFVLSRRPRLASVDGCATSAR